VLFLKIRKKYSNYRSPLFFITIKNNRIYENSEERYIYAYVLIEYPILDNIREIEIESKFMIGQIEYKRKGGGL
jgi:hypothetical protein